MNKPIDYNKIIDACVAEKINASSQHAEDEASITCYENEVPSFIKSELAHLYGNLFSSFPYLEINNKLTPNTSTYIARNGKAIITVFLFQRIKQEIRVINKGMTTNADELGIFCNFIFTKYDSINVISLESVNTKVDHFPFPHQHFDCPSDIILKLPATQEEYLATLGTKARNNIKRAMARLSSDHPSFRMDFYEKDELEESDLHRIISLNKVRMSHLKKVYVRESEEVQKIVDLSKTFGLIGVVTIDGSTCGGSIGYLVGQTHVGHIISHDPNYDKYSLGMLSIYFTICECIARGCKEFNFMSGNNPYKSIFGGVPRSLGKISIYRSKKQLFLNPQIALSMIYGKWAYRSQLWVQIKLGALKKAKAEGKLDTRSKVLFFILHHSRTIKDHVSAFIKRSR